MSARLKRHSAFLRTLHRASEADRKRLLKSHCNKDFIGCMTECCKNVLKGNVPMTTPQKKILKRKRHMLHKIALKKTSQTQKKKIIQSGGFIGALLGPIVSVLGSLFGGNR